MNSLQLAYAAFYIAVVLAAVGFFLIYRNDFVVTETSRWVLVAAMPFLTVGLPAVVVRHTSVFDSDEEKRQSWKRERTG